MFGEINGVAALLKDYAPCALFIHCVAHRLALASKHALAEEAGPIEAIVDDVYSKLYGLTNKSDVRAKKQRVLQAEFTEPQNGFIQPGDTRWLSNVEAADRVLQEIHSSIGLVRPLRSHESVIRQTKH